MRYFTMEVDVIQNEFKSSPTHENFDMTLNDVDYGDQFWNSDITRGGCCLLWSPDSYTKSCSRLAERCRKIDEKIQAPTTADILACLKFEDHNDRNQAERAQRCLQFSTGFAISVENLFPCHNSPELLAECGGNSQLNESELTDLDMGYLYDRPYQQFTKRVSIEDPDKIEDCRYYNNPFDPNLSFNGFTEVFKHIPYNNNVTQGANYCGPNFLLAFDNSTELFNEYLREYSEHVKQLTHDIRSVEKRPSYFDPMTEVEMIAHRNKNDTDYEQMWSTIKKSKELWDSVKLANAFEEAIGKKDIGNVIMNDDYNCVGDCKTNTLEECIEGISNALIKDEQMDDNSYHEVDDTDPSLTRQDGDGSGDIDFGSDDITSVADIVQRVSRKYADRNYSEQDIHNLLISVLKNKKLEEVRQQQEACQANVDRHDVEESVQMENLRTSSQGILCEDINRTKQSPKDRKKENNHSIKKEKDKTSLDACYSQKNSGEPVQNFPYSSSMFWENNDVSSTVTPAPVNINQQPRPILNQAHNGPMFNSVGKSVNQNIHHLPYHQPYLHHHVPVPQFPASMVHPLYQQPFQHPHLQANLFGQRFRQQFDFNKPHKGNHSSHLQNVQLLQQPARQPMFTVDKKTKEEQRKDVTAQENIQCKPKDHNARVHKSSKVDHLTPTFVLGPLPQNVAGSSSQHGVLQGHPYNLAQPKPTFILPHFNLPAYHQAHSMTLIPQHNIGVNNEHGSVTGDSNVVQPNDPNYRLDDEIWYINGVPHRHARPVSNTATSLPFYPHVNNQVHDAHNGGINRRIAEQVSKINKTFTEPSEDNGVSNTITNESDQCENNLSANNNLTERSHMVSADPTNDLKSYNLRNGSNKTHSDVDVNNNCEIQSYECYCDFVIPDEEITCFDEEEMDSSQGYYETIETLPAEGEVFNDQTNNNSLNHFYFMENSHVSDHCPFPMKNESINVDGFLVEPSKITNISMGPSQFNNQHNETTVSNSARQIRVLGRNRHKKERIVKKRTDRNQRTLLKII